MAHRIVEIEQGSIADQCGLRPGDLLLTINGEKVVDQIDYQFLTAQEKLVMEIQSGENDYEIALEKDENEPLGIVFESTLMSRPRECANHCVFCFIDQMPPGMRTSLYVKDDDWRLSLMMGNYITLTNLSDKEFDRIISRRASPLYISVHATDGAVRADMMKNPRAVRIMEQLHRLRDAGIQFHCQIVLCPGFNDGTVLDETIRTLAGLYPAAQSAALVPVGLTRHRDGLTQLTPYTKETAAELVNQSIAWQGKLLSTIGTRFVFPADEFYCLSGIALPSDEAYETYPQIENGVGLLRSFEKEFAVARAYAEPDETKPRSVVIATGTSVAPFLREMIDQHPLPGVDARVLAVQNSFFGPSVTVAGLLTGQDLLAALAEVHADELLLSETMLRHEGDMFLDDTSLDTLREKLGIPVHIVGNDGAEFFYALQGELYDQEENHG